MRPVIVLPLARIGTVVSSPCSRSAASTWRSISAWSGCSAVVQAPTWSASVDRLRSMPSRPIALALPVQRLMLAELLEQDHGQQVGAGKAARRHMERRRRLGDRLAVPARELLAHRLDHLPLARDHLQRLGDVLAQLGQLRRAAAGAALRRGDHDALARQMRRGTACATAACAGTTARSASAPPPARPPVRPRSPPPPALRAEAPSAPAAAPCAPSACRKAARRSFSISSLKWAISASVPAFTACARAATASASKRAARSARIIACAAARSDGSDSNCDVTPRQNHIRQQLQSKTVIPPMSDATSPADVASRCRTADSRAAPARSSPRRRPGSATRNGLAPGAS